MYQILKTSHSHFAWLALAFVALAVIMAFVARMNKKSWSKSDFKFALFGLIAAHIQFLMGLILYFISPLGLDNLSGATMKDSVGRLFALEHPLMNIIAIALITIGYSKAKKLLNTDRASKTVMIYYGIGLILILSRVPWSSWLA